MKSIFCVFILALATTLSVHAEDEGGGMNGDRAQARSLSEVNPVDGHAFGGELDVYLQALQSADSQAEAHYQDALNRLKARAADFAPMVEQMYWTARGNDFFKRWALVHALGELEVAPAVRSLREIALAHSERAGSRCSRAGRGSGRGVDDSPPCRDG